MTKRSPIRDEDVDVLVDRIAPVLTGAEAASELAELERSRGVSWGEPLEGPSDPDTPAGFDLVD